MKPREITRTIISLLEERSGYPVQISADPKLATIATVRMARGTLPAHLVLYKPSAGESPDYAICWQCAIAMRLFECPPDRRFQIAASREGEQAVAALLSAPGGLAQQYRLDQVPLESLKHRLLGGLITHLRSIPVGLRVSIWLGDNYPLLKELEAKHVEKELGLGREALAPPTRNMIPSEIFQPTHAINAAYAIFWAKRLDLADADVVNPYRSMGFEPAGEKLLDIYRDVPDDPLHDNELIDRWANSLKIRRWYSWIPYEAP